MTVGSSKKRLLIALAFLLPNLLGFVVFTAGPVVFSLGMSFTDWALTKHNAFSNQSVKWIGIQNYERLLVGDESRFFWNYFANTAFLMLGIPVGIALSLLLAVMIHAGPTPQSGKGKLRGVLVGVVLTAVTAGGVWMMTTAGPAPAPGGGAAVMSTASGLTDLTQWDVDRMHSNAAVLAAVTLGTVVTLGLGLGTVFFRTIYYLPSLLAGVAMFLLWKTLYRPRGGLINAGLAPVLGSIEAFVKSTPAWMFTVMGWAIIVAAGALAVWMLVEGIDKLRHRDIGVGAMLGRIAMAAVLALVGWGLGRVVLGLPERAVTEGGFKPPDWLIDPAWAKTALIVMGTWCGVGGGNMLLYLAGLSNVPPELNEAASIDGATGWQRFKHVTWPQLAPTTFFIVIMSTIGGLQGGFEQAMVMTGGKAETTVLTYYLYNVAFTDQFQLGLASAIAWVMFAMIFAMTAVNFRYGSRLTNE
jgi:multiple sugar transport system permease protein